jgi:hypothetical protein
MDILIDFDGTVVTKIWPQKGLGKDIGAQYVLKRLIREEHRLVLFTMRSHKDEGLQEALDWFKDNEIPLYGIQSHPEQLAWTDSPKAYGDLIIDDTALGIPLIENISMSVNPYVDWKSVEILLEKKNILRKGFSI